MPSHFVHAASSPSAFVTSSLPPPHHDTSHGMSAAFGSRPPLVDSPFPLPFQHDNIERFTKSNVSVQIERISPNERRISGEMILANNDVAPSDGRSFDARIDDLWSILTDYDNLSSHVPNLVESRILSHPPFDHRQEYSSGTDVRTTHGPRVYQRGSQRIWGFEFGADVTLDMKEIVVDYAPSRGSSSGFLSHAVTKKCILDFKCVRSQFFSVFDGRWILEESLSDCNGDTHDAGGTTTAVKYVVDVRPKGPVPVAALEWRIKEDVPTNMLGVVTAAATMAKARREFGSRDILPTARVNGDFRGERLVTRDYPIVHGKNGAASDWYKDETMAMYL
ncbi:hypothetical protein ACHAWX_001755 [Stephanocyclus meneghinianus]